MPGAEPSESESCNGSLFAYVEALVAKQPTHENASID
jgi:hypothetical protein